MKPRVVDDDQERFLLINGRRWRKTDPNIPEAFHNELVSELMSARRSVRAALKTDDPLVVRLARDRVQDAKVALGERGRAWWLPIEEVAMQDRLVATIRSLLRKRGPLKTICPSEASRVCGGINWRNLMDLARSVAWQLSENNWLDVIQRGELVQPPVKGPIRLRQRTE